MSNKIITLRQKTIVDIADAIRNKTGSSELIKIEEHLVKSITEYTEVYNENNNELHIDINNIIDKADNIIYKIL
jgi:hypothetical protein